MEPQLVIAGLSVAVLLGAALRALALRAWRTETVQDWVLRLTGESRYVPTSYLDDRPIVHGSPRGPLVGRRQLPGRELCGEPARASAPAVSSLPGDGAAGSTARPDAAPSPMAHPSVGAGTFGPHPTRAETALPRAAARQGGPQLTAAAQGPRHRAAAVSQPGGES